MIRAVFRITHCQGKQRNKQNDEQNETIIGLEHG